jgi:hypothetical protein
MEFGLGNTNTRDEHRTEMRDNDGDDGHCGRMVRMVSINIHSLFEWSLGAGDDVLLW